MLRRKGRGLLLVAFVCLTGAGLSEAAVMTGGGYTIHATVMGSAGGTSGTLGETFVGRMDDSAAGGGTELCAGFWCVVRGIDETNVWIALHPGLNLFGYPVELPVPYRASDLLSDLTNPGESGEAMRYNGSTLESRDTNGLGPDYDIVSGEGYFVYLGEAKTVHFQGPKVCRDIVFIQGLNLVSFPCPPSGYTASDLMTDLGGPGAVASIQRFDPETATFQTLASDGLGAAGRSFPIRRGEAYLVNLTAAGATVTFP